MLRKRLLLPWGGSGEAESNCSFRRRLPILSVQESGDWQLHKARGCHMPPLFISKLVLKTKTPKQRTAALNVGQEVINWSQRR